MSDTDHSAADSSEDEDYVPEQNSDEEYSGDEDNKKNRVRKGANKTSGQHGDSESDDNDDNVDEDKEQEILAKQQQEDAAKKGKQEDMWAAFKRDTGMLPSKSSKLSGSSDEKVSITRTYDFAGEAVVVTKTVDANSAEAKNIKKEEVKKTEVKPAVKDLGSLGFKRKGGLSSVLGQISKKPKMSTLEKSKLDWESFKDHEGIHQELQNYNKDGYLEKQGFLQRTDERQFERERDMRQGKRKM